MMHRRSARSTTRRSTTSAVGRIGGVAYSPDGYAVHRTYTDDRSIDETVIVHDGDVFLVPAGYHGPCVAAPGYPLYYLNVMASDAGPRKLAFTDDPPQHWIRATWTAWSWTGACR